MKVINRLFKKSDDEIRREDSQKVLDFLLKEYDQLFIENRNIIEKRISIYKVLAAALIALLGYVLTGLIFYIKVRGETIYPIPQSLAYGYSLLGIILTISVYSLFHNAFFYLGPSKKHTVRNWKAIHSIRTAFKSINNELSDFILLPDIINHPHRPRLSSRWELGAFIYPIYHLIFYFILGILLIPFFATYDPKIGLNIQINSLKSITTSLFFLFPFLIFKLVTGGKPMRDYIANIIEARRIGLDKTIFPSARDAKITRTPSLLWYYNFFLVIFSFLIWTDHFIINFLYIYHDDYFSIKLILTTIALSLLGEVIYLLFVGVLEFKISFRRGIIRINLSRIGKAS